MTKKLAFVAILFILTGCSGTPESKVPPQERKVQTYKVTCQEVLSYVEATGSIQPDLEGSAKIVSPLAGTIESIFVKVGHKVTKGTPLASIRSFEVSDTYSNYLTNLSQVKQAERVYNLNKQLYDVGAVTKNDLLTSEANYEQSKALSEALKRKMEIYGVNPELGFTDKQNIKCPIDGLVVEIQGHIGDRVDTSNPIMTVADPGKVMVVANIYDTEILKVQKGRTVTFYTDIFPNTPFQGVITYISDASDLDSKTIKTYIKIVGEQSLFRQNMFLKIKIINSKKKLPVIPKTALLFKDGKFSVYVKIGEKDVIKEVKPAFEVTEKQIAVEGLKEGDEVILSAIDMEKT